MILYLRDIRVMTQLKHPWQCSTYKCIVHEFLMSDVEDIDLWAAASLYEFEKSERGKWIMEHAVSTPIWSKTMDANTISWRIIIKAEFDEQTYIFWKLKYD